MRPLPVTVLSGFFGAGKTSVLTHLLNHYKASRLALIINDLAEVHVERRLLSSGEVAVRHGHVTIVDMSNRCLGCTLRERLARALHVLARDGRYDHVLLECSALSEPLIVSEVFRVRNEEGQLISTIAKVDSFVTVVNVADFWRDYEDSLDLRHYGMRLGENDARTVSELLVNQVEYAHTLVLNKIDLVTQHDLRHLTGILRRLNPDAALIPVQHGRVPVERILRTDHSSANREGRVPRPGWMKMIQNRAMPESTDEHLSSVVYRARRPFHPRRFWNLIHQEWSGVVRSKGYYWIASQPDYSFMWSQIAGACQYERLGRWWIGMPEHRWPKDADRLHQIESVWDLEFGDRRTDLAIIGFDLDRASLLQRLSAALVTNAELALDETDWRAFDDPFPKSTATEETSELEW
jgi:G3E family GTPase